ncbi:hypothetical protein NDU88_010933 [Pleurodeles waltl]|uniref:Uncharacterized protein n=1 Tax=Pleurodeles waltl TaxID=8319 RepID=A0AAV7QVR7_PLEWA|nr:hypothetical protein NDU88_010933 [Pleurodeles waltl]
MEAGRGLDGLRELANITGGIWRATSVFMEVSPVAALHSSILGMRVNCADYTAPLAADVNRGRKSVVRLLRPQKALYIN